MKVIDRYILSSFIFTFVSVFVILYFIFILQTIWLFISELAGKDLNFLLIIKFLLYASPRLVTLVLPLTVLLASIMTFGDLAENYEFAAMKSSGISLKRTMIPLVLFMSLLTVLAFFFANNVIPYAEYKFINFRKNIAQVKPAMIIVEGQFSDLGSHNIKVNKKSGENDEKLEGITIHKKSKTGANTTVIKAQNGELVSSKNSNILQMILYNGYYYEDITPQNHQDRNKYPFVKSYFDSYIMKQDLNMFNVDVDQETISNTNTMLNVRELKYTLDSLETNYNRELASFSENITDRMGIYFPTRNTTVKKDSLLKTNILESLNDIEKSRVLEIAINSTSSSKYSISNNKVELEYKQKNINNHWIALHEKFVIAYSCLLMFFIGAPLGAIIKKGGLGLPIVFAVLIFIIYHFINTFSKKIAQEDEITPFLGAWMASFLLTPFAIFITQRATNDAALINTDAITVPIQKIVNKLFKNK